MSLYEQRLEMRGMRRSEIIDYFISIGAKNTGNEIYSTSDWSVDAGAEAFVALGRLKIPATIVVFKSSDKTVLDKAIAAFRLRFLSAGG